MQYITENPLSLPRTCVHTVSELGASHTEIKKKNNKNFSNSRGQDFILIFSILKSFLHRIIILLFNTRTFRSAKRQLAFKDRDSLTRSSVVTGSPLLLEATTILPSRLFMSSKLSESARTAMISLLTVMSN